MVDIVINQDIIIYEVQNVKLLAVPNKADVQTVFENDTLQVIQNEQQEIFIKVNSFQYQLFQETPIYLTAYQTHRSYIFPCIQVNYAVLLSNNSPNHEDIYDCLEQILTSLSNLIYNQGQKEQKLDSIRKSQMLLKSGEPNLTPEGDNQIQESSTPMGDDKSCDYNTPQGNEEVEMINYQIKNKQNIQEQQLQMKLVQQSQELLKQNSQQEESKKNPQNSNSIAKYIGLGGSFISKGIQVGAGVVHSGIQMTGNFFEKQINKKNNIKVNDSTKNAIKLIKTFSGRVIQVTSLAASQIINTSIQISSMAISAITNKIDRPSTNTQNQSFQYLREVASASLQATSSILDNLDQSADKIGKQINETATQIVQKKFGDDAAEIVNDGVQVALNVNGAYRNINQLAIQKVAIKTAKESIKQFI
ncbi:hypothetical protein ABPG72_003075 [Tetrahymena utriculariae]